MKPNVVFILSDQHNTNRLADTPTLDAFRNSGVDFTDTYCSSPLCVPSRSGLLTGKLPSKTDVWNNLQSLRSDEATLPSLLATAGYETVLAGRMHFILDDQKHGYEQHLVGEITPTFPRPERQNSVYGFLKGTPDQSRVSIEKSGKGKSSVHSYDNDVADAAISFLENRSSDRPLFLTVGFYGPHCPFVAEEKLYDKYYERFSAQKAFRDIDSLHPEIRRFISLRGIENISDEEIRRVTAAYYANVEYMDILIGRVMHAVEKTIGLENTVIIYASDHGESLGAHGLFWKSNFYKESVNVPMIYSWKNHFENHQINAPVSLIDIAPTLLELAGAESIPDADGVSLLPELLGKRCDYDRSIFSMLADIKGDKPSAMLRKGKYKLIKFESCNLPLLFDLEKDPDENVNLAADHEYEDTCSRMLSELHIHWDEDSAAEELQRMKKEASLLKAWVKAANPEVHGEWSAANAENFLI